MFKIIAKEWAADCFEWVGNQLMNAAMDPILPDGWLSDHPKDFRCISAILVGSVAGLCTRVSERLNV